jgi:hypothetical protein
MDNLFAEIPMDDIENVKYIVGLRSEYTKQLANFHNKIKPPTKNGHVNYGTNSGQKKYDYVRLEDLIKSIDEALKDSGMTWSQESEVRDGVVRVRTIIMASNGWQTFSPWLEIKATNKSQEIGSALTYAKRYSLSTAFGVNSEADDDGEQARTANKNDPSQGSKKTSQSQRSNKQQVRWISVQQTETIKNMLLTLSKLKRTTAEDEAIKYLARLNLVQIRDLNSSQADSLIKQIDMDIKQLQENNTNRNSDPIDFNHWAQ